MKYLKISLFFLLIGCSTSKVIVDFDSEISFDDFKSFSYYEDLGEGLNEFDVKRVISVLDLEMQQRGFNKADNPDFYINVISKTSKSESNNTIGVGIGSGGRNGGIGISGGIPIGSKKLNEEFILEFVNSKTDKIIWEGVFNSIVKEKRKPEEKILHFKEIIKRILDKYPPNKKPSN